MTSDGANFELLADYPNPDVPALDAGCLVALDDNNLFLAGGDEDLPLDGGSARAYIYNRD